MRCILCGGHGYSEPGGRQCDRCGGTGRDEVWKGIYKVLEECGELTTALAKLGPYPHGNHPGRVDLHQDILDEMADVTGLPRDTVQK